MHLRYASCSIRFPFTATKWYTTIRAIAAMPRLFEMSVKVESEIILTSSDKQ